MSKGLTRSSSALTSSEREGGGEDEDGEDSPLEDIHERLGNGLMLLVACRVTYLMIFKRALAHFRVLGPPKSPPK